MGQIDLEAKTYVVGDVQVTKIVEQVGAGFHAHMLFPDWDPAVLGQNHDLRLPDIFIEAEGRFISSIHTWVIRTRRHVILIDTCAGNHKHRPHLPRLHRLQLPYLERLAVAGVHPEQVDFVLCTHLHADHCGWNTRLVDGRWVPTFPNARYIFSKAELDFWTTQAGVEGFNEGVYEDSVLPVVATGQVETIDGAGAVGEGLFLEPTPGHSVGHVALRLESLGQEALFSGDVMHQPVQVLRPDWNSCFCEDPELARRSRRWLLEQAAERGATVFTAHFAATSAGRVNRRNDTFAWTFT